MYKTNNLKHIAVSNNVYLQLIKLKKQTNLNFNTLLSVLIQLAYKNKQYFASCVVNMLLKNFNNVGDKLEEDEAGEKAEKIKDVEEVEKIEEIEEVKEEEEEEEEAEKKMDDILKFLN